MKETVSESRPGSEVYHVPGVLSLYRQSLLSLNFLQGTVDYWQNALPYFSIRFDEPGARFLHNHWDQSENIGRSLYATVLARIICGMADELPVEKCWKQLIYQSIPEGEGLSYRPNPSPYDIVVGARDEAAEQVAMASEPVLQADFWDNRSVFTGLLLSSENTGDRQALRAATKMVEQIKGLAHWDGDCAYFRYMAIPLGWDPDSSSETPVMGQHMGGWISPLIHYYQITGDEEALKLSKGLGRAFLRTYPKTLLASATDLEPVLGMNSHSLLFMLAGLARLYRITNDREFLDWAKWQFDGILRHQCSEMGWTAEFMPFQPRKGGDSCETCSLADRIDMGIQLAQAGYPEYWDDVQKCAFNYLVEAQLKDASWMPLTKGLQDNFWMSTYRIPERSVGAYVGWGAPNDFVDNKSRAPGRIQNCCGAHGVFACYQLWNNAVRRDEEGAVQVNLALSCDTPWCTVVTHAPVRGRIEIGMKVQALLRVRLSDWVSREAVKVSSMSGETVKFQITGRWLELPGQESVTVVIEYPMREESKEEKISGQSYVARWRDDYVMEMEPRGESVPLFDRDLVAIAESYMPGAVWPPRIETIDW